MKLTAHFSYEEFTHSEFAVRNRISNIPPKEVLVNLHRLAARMEIVRSILGKSIIVSSAYRNPQVNAGVGGASTSAHINGNACDFICPTFGVPNLIFQELRKHVDKIDYDQLILEYPSSDNGGWIHLGLSQTPRRMAFVKGA